MHNFGSYFVFKRIFKRKVTISVKNKQATIEWYWHNVVIGDAKEPIVHFRCGTNERISRQDRALGEASCLFAQKETGLDPVSY